MREMLQFSSFSGRRSFLTPRGSHDSYVDVVLGTVEFPNVEKVVVRVTAAEPERWRPINVRNLKLIPKP